jgi:hypothetical protein
MGIDSNSGADLATVFRNFTLTGSTAGPWVPGLMGSFNIVLAGTWSGSIVLEESYDNGTTAVPSTNTSGLPASMNSNGGYSATNTEPGVLHRLRPVGITGSCSARLSAGAMQ